MSVFDELGLTPIYTRLAARYMSKGEGEYPCNSFGYDKVKVSVDKAWNNYAKDGNEPEYSMTTRVEFYKSGQRVKWIEFKTNMIGGGSKESGLKEVK